MASYGSLDQLKRYLNQFAGDTSQDTVLQEALDRATSIINLELGVTLNLTAAATGSRTIYGDDTPYLTLPDNGQTVTAVTTLSGYTVPSYVEQDGMLLVTTSAGILAPRAYAYGLGHYATYNPVWLSGVPYTVAATYGYNADVLTALTEACLELAIRLWRFRDAGGGQEVGTDAAVIEVKVQFAPLVRDLLKQVKAQTQPYQGVY